MYRVIIYWAFAACYATEGQGSSKKLLEFNTQEDAEAYGRSQRWTFEAVKVND